MSQKPSNPHTPVLLTEVLNVYADRQLEVFFDGTVGAGGHAGFILAAHPEIKRYIACDRDPEALEIAKEHLKPWSDRVEFVRGGFEDLDRHLGKKGIQNVDGFFLIWGSRLCN